MLDRISTSGATVLVVDDAPPNIKLLRLILKDAGFRVLEATNGPEALATLRREKPDAMVLDVRMPGMTGYDVCREVRHDTEFATLPVIMVTALSLPEERIKGIESGATDFITKPFNKKELLARLQLSLALAKSGKNAIVPQLPGAVVIADADWAILCMSPLASILLGISANGIDGLDFTELLDQAAKGQVLSGRPPPRAISVIQCRQRKRRHSPADPRCRCRREAPAARDCIERDAATRSGMSPLGNFSSS